MTGDKAVELINEWLNLAKEVGDMNLNRMEYDEERYNYAMDRMDVIRQEINDYHEKMNKCKKKKRRSQNKLLFFIDNGHDLFLDPVQKFRLIHLHQECLQIPDQCLDTNY